MVRFLLMMYTDIHGVLFQFAFNQRRYMVIHELCCWSQSNPGSGLRRFIVDRVVNYPLQQWRFRITQRTHKFSAQHLGVSPELTIVKPDGVRATFLPSRAKAFIKRWLFQIFKKEKKMLSCDSLKSAKVAAHISWSMEWLPHGIRGLLLNTGQTLYNMVEFRLPCWDERNNGISLFRPSCSL